MRKRKVLVDMPWSSTSELGSVGVRLERAMNRRFGRSPRPYEAKRWGGRGWKVRDPGSGSQATFSDTGQRLVYIGDFHERRTKAN